MSRWFLTLKSTNLVGPNFGPSLWKHNKKFSTPPPFGREIWQLRVEGTFWVGQKPLTTCHTPSKSSQGAAFPFPGECSDQLKSDRDSWPFRWENPGSASDPMTQRSYLSTPNFIWIQILIFFYLQLHKDWRLLFGQTAGVLELLEKKTKVFLEVDAMHDTHISFVGW